MYSRDVTLLFTSLSIVVLGSVAFFSDLSLNTELIAGNLIRVILYSVPLALLGFLIGKILDYAMVKK